MPTKTSYDLYRLDELAPAVQAKVLDRERCVNVDDEWWSEATVSAWKGVLAAKGYEEPRILFSGFGSQGDGACFEASVNLGVWLSERKPGGSYDRLLAAFAGDEVAITIRHAGRYCHAYSTEVVVSYDGGDARIDAEIDEVRTEIVEDVVGLSQQLYRDLEEEYFALTDDRAVAETLRSNDTLFHVDGCRAHS
jgi:hypothetical protein